MVQFEPLPPPAENSAGYDALPPIQPRSPSQHRQHDAPVAPPMAAPPPHRRCVERQRDHRCLGINPYDAGDLRGIERPPCDSPAEYKQQQDISRVLGRGELQRDGLQDQRRRHACKSQARCRDGADPVGERAAQHVTDRRGRTEDRAPLISTRQSRPRSGPHR